MYERELQVKIHFAPFSPTSHRLLCVRSPQSL